MIIRRATLRLTIQYSLVLLCIVALFAVGVAIYASFAFDLELPEASEQGIDRANATLREGLIICFAVLVVIVPPISYWLARRTLRPVRENLEAQQRFVDDASHELRTPIAVAQGELELALLQERDPEQYRTSIAESLAALQELSGLTNDLLLLTNTDRLDEHADIVELRELGDRALATVPPEVRERVVIRMHGDARMRGSAELLARAIANLLENAGKYAAGASPIELTLEATGDQVRISVRDQGPGMTPEQARRAFDRFWRADSARSTPGHGIGLSIVQRVTALHAGRASIRTVPGQGTEVVLELPRVS